MLLINSSRICRPGIDEEYYRSNTLWAIAKRIAVQARLDGHECCEYIEACNRATTIEDQHYFAYFAGCAARRAFTAAALVLDILDKRPLKRDADAKHI